MRSHLCFRGVALVAVWLLPLTSLLAKTPLPPSNASPRELVQAALASELEGPSEVRKELLDQALVRDPQFPPARWQSGFVRWEAEWLTPEQVASCRCRSAIGRLPEIARRDDRPCRRSSGTGSLVS